MARPLTLNGGVAPEDLARVAVNLGRNLAALYAPALRSAAPAHVTWYLTERCPMRCGHCALPRPHGELGAPERLAVAERLGRSRTWGVSVIGGEVMVVRELFDCLGVLKQHGKTVFLGTSGYGLPERLAEVLALGVDYVILSLDGTDAATHDTFRGRAGLYDAVCEVVDRTRRERRGRKPRVQVRFTLNRGNLHQLGAFIDEWSARADNIQLQIIQDNGLHRVRDRAHLFRPEDRPEVERVLAALRERHAFLRHRYYDLMARYVFEPAALQRDIGFRCLLVPQTSIAVQPDGALRLCSGRRDAHVGHVLRDDLDVVWRDGATQAVRTRMQSREYGCMCWESRCAANLDLLPVHARLAGTG